ncbi:MAG: hypothetical protein HOY76_39115 [Streptomyces sp.]|nr:hypothetical protein [Streptomyces sp.]NUS89977.1 hypothetical protein [Streptomyces sp.]
MCLHTQLPFAKRIQATVFAQAVGLGATWTTDFVRWVGEAVSTETRAIRARDDWMGLNVWPRRHGRSISSW